MKGANDTGRYTTRECAFAGLMFFLGACTIFVALPFIDFDPATFWPLYYQAATLGLSYPEAGFVRRGLGGTLIHLTGLQQVLGTLAFHAAAAAALALGCAHALRGVAGSPATRIAFVAVLAVLALFWATDAGRIDMAVAACLTVAALCVRAGLPLAAAAALVVGLAFHEEAWIYGAPMALALLLDPEVRARAPRRSWVAGALLLLLVAIAYAGFDRYPRIDNAEATSLVYSKVRPDKLVDWALYYAMSGMRGVRTSICQNLVVNPNYPLQVAAGLVLLALTVFILVGRDRRLAMRCTVGALPPYAFLCAVANDLSRWTALAAFVAWLVAACDATPAADQAARGRHRSPWMVLALAALLLVLMHPRYFLKAPHPIYSPSPFIEAIAVRLGAPITPDATEVLRRCDPSWRDVLTERRRR